jgi:hypothetical protein
MYFNTGMSIGQSSAWAFGASILNRQKWELQPQPSCHENYLAPIQLEGTKPPQFRKMDLPVTRPHRHYHSPVASTNAPGTIYRPGRT